MVDATNITPTPTVSEFQAARVALVGADHASRVALEAARAVAVKRGVDRELLSLLLPALRMSSAAHHMSNVILSLIENRLTGGAR